MNPEQVDKALKVATKIGEAVVAKIPKHKLHVRRFADEGRPGYIEIALQPEGMGHAQELATAYSDDFFLEVTKENISEKATRVYKALKGLITGQP